MPFFNDHCILVAEWNEREHKWWRSKERRNANKRHKAKFKWWQFQISSSHTIYVLYVFFLENYFFKIQYSMIRRNFPRFRSFCCILTNTSVRKNICQILRFAFLKIFIFTRKPLLKLTRQIETQNFRGFSVLNLRYFSRNFSKLFYDFIYTRTFLAQKWTIQNLKAGMTGKNFVI